MADGNFANGVLNTVLNNPTAATTTSGAGAVISTTVSNSPAQRRLDPLEQAAVNVVPDIAVGQLGIPPSLMGTAKAVSTSVMTGVLNGSVNLKDANGNIDVGSSTFSGITGTRIFASVNAVVTSNPGALGIPAGNTGKVVNALSQLINGSLQKSAAAQKATTTGGVLTVPQYREYINTAVGDVGGMFKIPATSSDASSLKTLFKNGVSDQLTDLKKNASTVGKIGRMDQTNAKTFGSKVYLQSALNPTKNFVFQVQPIISVEEKADYSRANPIHSPASILSYKQSTSRTFGISEVKLISRNAYEATQNLKSLWRLRSWTKPFFGVTTAEFSESDILETVVDTTAEISREVSSLANRHPTNQTVPIATPGAQMILQSNTSDKYQKEAIEALKRAAVANTTPKTAPPELTSAGKAAAADNNREVDSLAKRHPAQNITAQNAQVPSSGVVESGIGAPPEVLYLYGYSTENDGMQNLKRIPVVLESISYSYPNDVDYIPTTEGVPFPSVMTLTLSLGEAHAPREIEQFNLAAYHNGTLVGW